MTAEWVYETIWDMCTRASRSMRFGAHSFEKMQLQARNMTSPYKSVNCIDQPLPTCWSSHVRVVTSISRCCHGCLPLRVFEETASKRPESSWENHDAANVWCLGAFPHHFFARWHEIALGSTIVHLIHRKHCWLLIFDRYAWFNSNSNFCFMNCQNITVNSTACKSIHSLPINSVHQLYWVVIIHNNYINTWKVLTAASLGSSVSWFPMTCNGRDSGYHGVSSYCWNIMKLIWYAVFQYIPIISFYRDMKHEN